MTEAETETIQLELPEDVKAKFIAADTAFLEVMKAQGRDLLSAVQLLSALHRTAADHMEVKLHELVMGLMKAPAEGEA